MIERVAPALVVADGAARARIQGVAGLEALARSELYARIERPRPAGDPPVDPDAVAIWLFTSGTTGEPKAALLRHRHLVRTCCRRSSSWLPATTRPRSSAFPPYHIAGMATILSIDLLGSPDRVPARSSIRTMGPLAEQEAVTHAMVVPTMLGRFLDALEQRGNTLPHCGTSRTAVAGCRWPSSSERWTGCPTWASSTPMASPRPAARSRCSVPTTIGRRTERGSRSPARLASAGRPLPTLELEIRDPWGGVLPAGETGEIHVRGEQIAGEYLGRSVLTPDGWFPTNDSGHFDEAGFLFVDGRLDDVIVRGGENMSPGEIEDVLLEHPAVAEAGVTGVPDDEWGEVAAAAVVFEAGATTTEAELQAWVRDRLRSSRTPVVVDVRAALPYNETGKLLRRVLKDELGRVAASKVTPT